ncbi:helix-turn-helix domain-containing protein [Streptomyces sp. NPDC004232]|uniref:helix-turn-helix domain-containing protein n=1 Tax=Streptomyces sp. NPDC004232 TaxID=3154454 RepID=UPI0033BF92C2
MTSPPQLLSIRQVADCLGVSQVTVRRLYRAEQLPVVWVGRVARIPGTAVDTFIAKSGTRSLTPAVT